MKTFTIDIENNISAFGTPEEAAATTATPFDTFANEKELVSLVGQWPAERLVAIWNSIPGVKPVKSFKTAKVAAGRIWDGIQSLGRNREAESRTQGKSWRTGGQGRARQGQGDQEGHACQRSAQGQEGREDRLSEGPREGTKTAQVLALLQRKNGATLAEIMEKMGWPRHTVRGFMAGAMKAGYTVESFKSEKGERSSGLIRNAPLLPPGRPASAAAAFLLRRDVWPARGRVLTALAVSPRECVAIDGGKTPAPMRLGGHSEVSLSLMV